MILPSHLLLIGVVLILGLLLLVLVEIQRSNDRRENEEMFGTKDFETKVAEYNLSPKEIRTLEKLVRASKFENKDAVLNSSHLFEAAVSDFYEFRNVDDVRDETLEAVARLRDKLKFDAANPFSVIACTRQFNVGNRVDLLLDGVCFWTVFPSSSIPRSSGAGRRSGRSLTTKALARRPRMWGAR